MAYERDKTVPMNIRSFFYALGTCNLGLWLKVTSLGQYFNVLTPFGAALGAYGGAFHGRGEREDREMVHSTLVYPGVGMLTALAGTVLEVMLSPNQEEARRLFFQGIVRDPLVVITATSLAALSEWYLTSNSREARIRREELRGLDYPKHDISQWAGVATAAPRRDKRPKEESIEKRQTVTVNAPSPPAPRKDASLEKTISLVVDMLKTAPEKKKIDDERRPMSG